MDTANLTNRDRNCDRMTKKHHQTKKRLRNTPMAPLDRTFRCHQSAKMTSPIAGACGPRISFPAGHRPEGRRISACTDPPLHNKRPQALPGPGRAGCRVGAPRRVNRQPLRGTAHNPRAEVGWPARVCGMERTSALLASWTSTTQKRVHRPYHRARRGPSAPCPEILCDILQCENASITE
jgi:hypothetical protein